MRRATTIPVNSIHPARRRQVAHKNLHRFRVIFALVLSLCWASQEITGVAMQPDTSTSSEKPWSADSQRPIYHVTPGPNFPSWLNDPNGPFHDGSVWHLYFQYNPGAAVWGDMHWGHATSPDLAHWTVHPPALLPDMPYDKDGVYSGSVSIVNGRAILSYTSVLGDNQTQSFAYTPKGGKVGWDWVKDPSNPLLSAPADSVNSDEFRDPTEFWHGSSGELLFAVGAGRNTGKLGEVLMYEFVGSGEPGEGGYVRERGTLYEGTDLGTMVECPDLFAPPLDGRQQVQTSSHGLYSFAKGNSEDSVWLLKGSALPQRLDLYIAGRMNQNGTKFTSLGGPARLIDGGSIYASKTFPGTDGKRLWVGWSPEEQPDDIASKRGWQGVMTVPRELTLSSDHPGLLLANPADGYEAVRDGAAFEASVKLDAIEQTGATLAPQGELDTLSFHARIDIRLSRPLEDGESIAVGIRGAQNGPEATLQDFNGTLVKLNDKEMVVDRTRSMSQGSISEQSMPLEPGIGQLEMSLLMLADASLVEIFGPKGAAVITTRLYVDPSMNSIAVFLAGKQDGASPLTAHVALSAWKCHAACQIEESQE